MAVHREDHVGEGVYQDLDRSWSSRKFGGDMPSEPYVRRQIPESIQNRGDKSHANGIFK